MATTREQLHANATAKAAQVREGRFPPNEESTKARLILPMLRCLGWNDESDEVEFEPNIGHRDAADVALRVNDKRRVLIEAKALGEQLGPDSEDQIGKYASRDDANLAILTNGRQWWCYVVRANGTWNERKFAQLDLLDNLDEFVDVAWSVVRREAFAGEESPALLAAQEYLAKRRDLDRADQELPKVWRQMLEQPDPELVRLLADKAKVASEEAVLEFLRGLTGSTPRSTKQSEILRESSSPLGKARLRAATLSGKPLAVHQWKDLLFEVAKQTTSTGRLRLPWRRPRGGRIVLSKQLSDLNKEKYGLQLPGGYWLDRWWGSSDCLEIARELLDAASIGRDQLRVEWEDRSGVGLNISTAEPLAADVTMDVKSRRRDHGR
jgi:hypothetical protein